MLLSAHQPVYLPGIILFSKIALSDAFMFLGHVQFARNGWQNRNQIRQGNNAQYLSVPVRHQGRFGQAINETEIANDHWRRKHLKSVFFAYKDRPFFNSYFSGLEEILSAEWKNLSDLNICIIKRILNWLEIDTKIMDSRDYDIQGHKSDLLVSACRAVGADRYVSNPGAIAYIDEPTFGQAGIHHLWQDFTHPVYDQGKDFLPDLSVIDLLFNTGPQARDIVRSASAFVENYPGPDVQESPGS